MGLKTLPQANYGFFAVGVTTSGLLTVGKVIFRLFFVLLVCSSHAFANGDYSKHQAAQSFVDKMVAEHKFDRAYVQGIIDQAERKQSILDAISRPAEKRLQWHEYREIFLKSDRINQGVKFWTENKTALEQAARDYGVDPSIVVAIIGVETRYGRFMGNYRVVDALTTLGFDYPRRAKFFTKQLEEFLLLAREQKQNPLDLKGSYAGAMGFGQFIPSSYRAYAVDYDNDDFADIWQNKTDAIGSVANYFKVHGWVDGEPVMHLASAQRNASQDEVNKTKRPSTLVSTWMKRGYSPAESTLSNSLPALVMTFEEKAGKAHWFAFNNFYVITRYNRSPLYARAVWELSEAIQNQYNLQLASGAES